jgi:hypothetical protein
MVYRLDGSNLSSRREFKHKYPVAQKAGKRASLANDGYRNAARSDRGL